MHAYRAIVDKRDQRAFLPRPIPDVARRRLPIEELTHWAGW